jgi:spermidine synthase
MFQPDRILFYNGVLQIRNSSAAALYEMYVHPAMLTHRNPRRVAVLGFEDGTMIREVLKHKSVEKVVLLKYDELLLNMTMEYFPEYNDCTFLGNKKANCMDDPRVTNQQAEVDKAAFDVIIVDEL